MALTNTERAVLEVYRREDEQDPDGAFAPYYHAVADAAGNADLAYTVCKLLMRAKYLECDGRQCASLLSAPSYWITDKGKEALSV